MMAQWMLGGFVRMASWADGLTPASVTVCLLTFLPLSVLGLLWAAQFLRCRTAEQALRLGEMRRRRLSEQLRRLKEWNQRAQERADQLKAANRDLEAFAYSVAHDLRAPLRAIDGFAGMLAEDHARELDDEGRRLLMVLRHEVDRMGGLIDGLLAFSRLGRRGMRVAETDMTSLVREVFDQMRGQAGDRQVEFQLGELPAARGDSALLRQVWANLLDNALKYTRHRPHARVTISGVQRGTENVYAIKDNGAGFDMRHAGKLFGVFQRLHREEEFEGIGVGLALVQRIVQRHGGRVGVRARLERGATFFFTLPSAETAARGIRDGR